MALSIHRQRETEADHFQSYSTDWSGPSMFMALKANSMFERRWSILSRVAESLKRATTSRERMRRMTTRMNWIVCRPDALVSWLLYTRRGEMVCLPKLKQIFSISRF